MNTKEDNKVKEQRIGDLDSSEKSKVTLYNQLINFIKKLSSDDEEEFLRKLSISEHYESFKEFSGPLPPPKVLKKYKKVDEKVYALILDMCKETHEDYIKSEDFGRNMLKYQLNDEKEIRIKSQNKGFILALVSLIFSFILIILDKVIVGSIFGGSTIIGLIALFFYGQKQKEGYSKSMETDDLNDIIELPKRNIDT